MMAMTSGLRFNVRIARRNFCATDPIGDRRLGRSRFWALEDEEDQDDMVATPSTEGVVRAAEAAGYTIQEVIQAEKELLANETKITGKVMERTIASKSWKGPLRPRRESPLRTIGDAFIKN
ncbi:hypothetical protein EJB05_50817 [Eragrostis curvula]|uniref:Uncharacterized protein n=1 Tax=Eragrostis curvula TaxID=38414 RepID=A0A5J9SXA2_9POAL|nr:hypothetical protein EJB05_50817 [Eragrostis curvula]